MLKVRSLDFNVNHSIIDIDVVLNHCSILYEGLEAEKNGQDTQFSFILLF